MEKYVVTGNREKANLNNRLIRFMTRNALFLMEKYVVTGDFSGKGKP